MLLKAPFPASLPWYLLAIVAANLPLSCDQAAGDEHLVCYCCLPYVGHYDFIAQAKKFNFIFKKAL